MTDFDLAWLAGYLEGEGCFAYNRGLAVRVCATDEDVVRRAGRLMGDARVFVTPHPREGYKTTLEASVRGEKAKVLMECLLPHMGARRAAKIRQSLILHSQAPGKPRGERVGGAKLREADVIEIRGLVAGGTSQRSLAPRYGVSTSAINLVVLRRNWRHVEEPVDDVINFCALTATKSSA